MPPPHSLRFGEETAHYTSVHPPHDAVRATARVTAFDRTGPEMEAMTAAATAGLTIYDMCKGVDRAIVIESVKLLEKSGGKSGAWKREEGP